MKVENVFKRGNKVEPSLAVGHKVSNIYTLDKSYCILRRVVMEKVKPERLLY